MIVGAGPTGLALALSLARSGIKVRLIEKLREPAATSRAIGIQASSRAPEAQTPEGGVNDTDQLTLLPLTCSRCSGSSWRW